MKLLIAIVATLIWASCAAPAKKLDFGEVIVIAHRGASAAAPENTMAAIAEALRQRADAIEIDLHQTQDGHVVVIHDAKVNRTTDGRGRVGDLTLAELRSLDAGGWFDERFRGERIPTLPEALDAVPHQVLLILELKGDSHCYPGVEANVVQALRAAGRPPDSVVLKSFHTDVLDAFRRHGPEFPRMYVFTAHIPLLNLILDHRLRRGNALDQDVAWLQKHSTFITRRFVERAQRGGFKVVAWDVHSERRMRAMLSLGVDAIETNHPALLKALIEKMTLLSPGPEGPAGE